MKKLFTLLILLLLLGGNSWAQTTLISPAGDGGFENGITPAANNWTAVNASVDSWIVGTVPVPSAGTNCGYVSSTPTGAQTWTYSQISTIEHLYYQNVTIPAGQSKLTLTFKWKAMGEGTTSSDWDNMKVFFGKSSDITPIVANTAISSSYQVSGPGAISGMYKLSSASWNSETILMSGTPGSTYRLVFSWKSDVSDIVNPPCAIDEVSLVSSVPGDITSTTLGGLWNSPATWVGAIVPVGDNVTIASGATVVVNQSVLINNLTVDGTLQWITTTAPSSTINTITAQNITIDPTGKMYAHGTVSAGATVKVTGNFTNNGWANFAALGSLLYFIGTTGTQTLGGSGTFLADMQGRGMIQQLFFTSLAACDISATLPQSLVTGNLAITAGSLNTNGKLSIDNTALCFGGLINRSIATVTVNNMGTGYTSAPGVAFTAAPTGGTTATGVANYDAATGTIRSITITNPGDGYRVAPTVTFSGGGGTGLTAVAALYQNFSSSSIAQSQKSAIATITGGININSSQGVGSVFVTNGGLDYTSAPTVGFALPVSYINLVTAGGSGYTVAPAVVFTGGGGTGAAGTAVVCRGQVVSVHITTAGSNYTSPPAISFTGGGGGTGAAAEIPVAMLPTATANINLALGMVTSFNVTNAGYGYIGTFPVVTLTGGTITTAASGAASRHGLYQLIYNYFAPATSNAIHTESAVIPANRRMYALTLANATGYGASFTNDITLYNSSPLPTFTGNIDMGGNTLIFEHPNYTGTSGGTTNYVSNGNITYKLLGSTTAQTRPFPFNSYDGTSGFWNNLVSMGSASTVLTEGSTIVKITGSYAGAPTGANMIGTRTLRLQTYGGLYGNLPTLRLTWNSIDNLVAQANLLYISQATATSGPWTIRSTASGTGSINPAGGYRTTATTAPGPIAITGDDYFGWEYDAPACPPPSAGTTTGITTTTAILNWTNGGTETLWNVKWGAPGFDPLTTGTLISGINAHPYTLNPPLTSNTAYAWYVQADCGSSQSTWLGPYTFTTLCDPITTLPWNEGFEGMVTVGSQILPACWSYQNVAGTSGPYSSNTSGTYYGPNNGTNFIYTYYANTTWVFTPGLSLTAGTSYDFSFYMMNKVVTSPVDFLMDVAYGSSNTAAGMTNVLAAGIVCSNSAYVLFKYTFTPATTGAYFFGVKSTSATSTPWYLSFDDFKLAVTPIDPTIDVIPTSLAFGYTPSGGTSLEKTYSLSGLNLVPATGSLTVTPPPNFEVSLTPGGPYSSAPITVGYTGGTLAATTIYVVFMPTAPSTYYTGNIANSGIGAVTQNVAVTGNSDLFTGYCASGALYTYDEEIFSVTVNDATNAYDCFTVAPGPGSILNRYSNFFPLGSLTSIKQGNSINFTVLENECDGATYYSNGCAIWIDFNHDGDFTDPGEQVYTEAGTTVSPRTITGSFVVPVGATLGLTAMRVTVAEGYYGATLTPCLSYGYGETEDYQVTITAGDFGTLQGFVYEQPGCTTPIGGATVSNGTFTTKTDGTGFYQFLNLPVGSYNFTASMTGYVNQVITGITVTLGGTTNQNFCLDILGTLQGYVYEQPACTTPIVGATVSNGTYTTLTDGTGFYQFLNLLPPGNYNFTASATGYVNQIINGIAVSANNTTIQNFCLNAFLAPPSNLQASLYGPLLNNVHLTWSAPGSLPPDQWIFWDDGVQYTSIGTNAAADFAVASRWPVADIAPYAGTYLTKIMFFPAVAPASCTYTIKVWTGTTPPTQVYSYTLPSASVTSGVWNTYTFPAGTGVPITGSQELWFGYEANTTTGYPAGCDNGPQIAGKGNMTYWSGSWVELTALNAALIYNWSIHGWVSGTQGPQPLVPIGQNTELNTDQMPVQNEGLLVSAISQDPNQGQTPTNQAPVGIKAPEELTTMGGGNNVFAPLVLPVLTGYNIYRNSVEIADNFPASPYNDLALPKGNYCYQVSAKYDNGGESAKIGPVCVDIYTCFPPTNIHIDGATTTTTTAHVTWTASTITPNPEWIFEYGPAGFAHGAGIGGPQYIANPFITLGTGTLPALTPGTAYDFYVRTFCTVGDSSAWVKKTFRTHYFDCPPGATAELEVCGTDANGGCNMTVPAFEPLACGETKCGTAYFDGSLRDTDWYLFTLTQTADVTWIGTFEFSSLVGIMASGCPSGAFLVSATGVPGATVSVTTRLVAGTYYAFASPLFAEIVKCDSLDKYYATLTCNTCLSPTALTATNITGTTADLGWTPGSNETAWEYVIGLSPQPVPTGAGTPTTTNPTNVTGLSGSSTYCYYVRSSCGGGNYGAWVGPYCFSTQCATFTLPFAESFDGVTFAPTCWTNIVTVPNTLPGTWDRQTTGIYPTCAPHSGAGMARYDSYDYIEGTTGILVTPQIAIPSDQFQVRFWMYRDNGYTALADLVNVYYNTSPNTAGATLLGTVNRSYLLSPVEATANQWYQYGFNLPAGTSGNAYIVFEAVSQYGNSMYLDDVSLFAIVPPTKTLNLKLYLEGLYSTVTGLMKQAQGLAGPEFGPGIADQVTVELHDATSPYAIAYTYSNVNLNTDGTASITTIPGTITGSYYVVIKHRNSIETWSSLPVPFGVASPIFYDFTTAVTQAFGNDPINDPSMKLMAGVFAIWGGNANADGIIDGSDMLLIDNASLPPGLHGYNPEDLNGDGIVDGTDMTMIDNNSQPPSRHVQKP